MPAQEMGKYWVACRPSGGKRPDTYPLTADGTSAQAKLGPKLTPPSASARKEEGIGTGFSKVRGCKANYHGYR